MMINKDENLTQEEILDKYSRIRSRELQITFISIIGFIMLCGITSIFLYRINSVLDVFLFIGYFGIVFWFSLRNWRCPSCGSWLGGIGSQVNPFFNQKELCCPHCGVRLV
jgi:hypothetical protein